MIIYCSQGQFVMEDAPPQEFVPQEHAELIVLLPGMELAPKTNLLNQES